MTRLDALLTKLSSVFLSLWAMPALALAQGAAGSPAQPGSAPAPQGGDGGGSGVLWILAAVVVLAIIWWAMSSRRRQHTMTR